MRQYLRYAELNHGIASFAVHGILGNEPTYSSDEFARKIGGYIQNIAFAPVLTREAVDTIEKREHEIFSV